MAKRPDRKSSKLVLNKKFVTPLLTIGMLAFQPQVQAAPPVTITVFAASSLTDSYTELAKTFMKVHKNWKISYSFLASSTLATQLNAGAPADLFVSASPVDMVLAKSRVPSPIDYVANRVVLAFKSGGKVKSFADLNQSGIKWIQCAHEVPCGMAADAALKAEGATTTQPVSYEPKVSSAVTKLVSGEVDAAIIYHTDVIANSKSLSEIAFSNRDSAITIYQIGLVSKSKHAAVTKTFLNFLLTKSSMALMRDRGFEITK